MDWIGVDRSTSGTNNSLNAHPSTAAEEFKLKVVKLKAISVDGKEWPDSNHYSKTGVKLTGITTKEGQIYGEWGCSNIHWRWHWFISVEYNVFIGNTHTC